MSRRAHEISATADGQITELIGMLSTLDRATFSRPCSGREKLGDGTIGAALRHTADNYQRIAGFVKTSDRMSAAHQPAGRSSHHVPRFLRVLGHEPQGHAPQEHGMHQHGTADTAGVGVDEVFEQLNASRSALTRIADLTDTQLDVIPPKDSFRFCDGQRTLEQVLTGLLKHQGHQLDAIRTALT